MQRKLPDIHTDGWIELAKRVVELAAADYRMYLRSAALYPHDEGLQGQLRDLEAFFRNGWFHCLLKIDGDALIAGLRKETHV